MNYSLNLDFPSFFVEYFIKPNMFLILALYSTGRYRCLFNQANWIIKIRSLSPVLRGGYRILSYQQLKKQTKVLVPSFTGWLSIFIFTQGRTDTSNSSRPLFSGVVIDRIMKKT